MILLPTFPQWMSNSSGQNYLYLEWISVDSVHPVTLTASWLRLLIDMLHWLVCCTDVSTHVLTHFVLYVSHMYLDHMWNMHVNYGSPYIEADIKLTQFWNSHVKCVWKDKTWTMTAVGTPKHHYIPVIFSVHCQYLKLITMHK